MIRSGSITLAQTKGIATADLGLIVLQCCTSFRSKIEGPSRIALCVRAPGHLGVVASGTGAHRLRVRISQYAQCEVDANPDGGSDAGVLNREAQLQGRGTGRFLSGEQFFFMHLKYL